MRLGDGAVKLWRAEPTFVQRQLLFAAVFVLTVTGLPLTGLTPTSWTALISSLAVLLLTTIAAVVLPWRRWAVHWRLLVPLGSTVAVGLLRAATGESASPYSFLIILPALAVGAESRKRWPLLLVAVGCDLVVFLPYLVLQNPAPASPELLLRALFVPFIATLSALAVHELARALRARMASVKSLQREQADVALQLRTARDTISSVIEGVTEQSIIATNRDGLIQVFNPGAEKILGILRTSVVGRLAVTDFHLPRELAAVDEHGRSGFAALVGEASTVGAEVRDWTYVAADGREIIMHLAVTPRYDPHGKVLGFLFAGTDMTEEREVARLKEEFVGLISHELRTPLSSILGYLELVLDDEDAPLTGEQRQYLSVVERNANRLLRLVGDLLFTAQVEAGRFNLVEHPVDLVAVIAASADTVRPAASSAGVRVEVQLPDATVVVSGDAVRLGQACDNLLSNAVKFTPNGGDVCISLEVDGHSAVVRMRDTGIGIAADEVDKLFTRFFRATTATSHAIAGVGLGLAITHAIIVAHHGELNVHSVEGVGTTFSFRLPLKQAVLHSE